MVTPTKTLAISWELTPGNPPHVKYYVDDSPVGEDNSGFDRILETIRSHKHLQVTLKIRHMSSLGGVSLIGSLPFRERFDELMSAMGENRFVYEFE